MATKDEALAYIRSLAQAQAVTRDELVAAFDAGSPPGVAPAVPAANVAAMPPEQHARSKVTLAEIISYIGGGIVFIGVTILLAQNWSTLSFVTKLLATLGIGAIAYAAGVILLREKRSEKIGTAMHLVGALVLPVGIYVLLQHFGVDTHTLGMQTTISGILFLTYLVSLALMRRALFILFSILYGTGFYFFLTWFMVEHNTVLLRSHFFEYQFLVAGLAWVLLGYHFVQGKNRSLSGFLYGFGLIALLGSTLALGGWKPNQNVIWELIYPFIAFGTLFLSVRVHSNSFLVFGTIFLMAYIVKLTAEYFSGSLGWPLSLMIAGFALIGVGYFSLFIRQRYIKTA